MSEVRPLARPIDPELEALPLPRRPWRRATLVTMAVTACLCLVLADSLVSEARYSLESGPPRGLVSLTHVQRGTALANAWVHGEAELASRSVEYRRPLDPDRFRLAAVADNPRLWVELRVPAAMEPDRYVPPN